MKSSGTCGGFTAFTPPEPSPDARDGRPDGGHRCADAVVPPAGSGQLAAGRVGGARGAPRATPGDAPRLILAHAALVADRTSWSPPHMRSAIRRPRFIEVSSGRQPSGALLAIQLSHTKYVGHHLLRDGLRAAAGHPARRDPRRRAIHAGARRSKNLSVPAHASEHGHSRQAAASRKAEPSAAPPCIALCFQPLTSAPLLP